MRLRDIGLVLIQTTTCEGFTAADLLQKQRREIPGALKIVSDCGTRLLESGASAALQIAAAYRLLPHEGVPTDDRKRRLTICCAIATPM
jgi:hypothetical protein